MPLTSTTTNGPTTLSSSSTADLSNSETNNSIDSTDPDRVIFCGGNNSVNSTNEAATDEHVENNDADDDARIIPDDEPIAPIRPPIHSKTKNWYSSFCNRWASLIGVIYFTLSSFLKKLFFFFFGFILGMPQNPHNDFGQLVLCNHMYCYCRSRLVLCRYSQSSRKTWSCIRISIFRMAQKCYIPLFWVNFSLRYSVDNR